MRALAITGFVLAAVSIALAPIASIVYAEVYPMDQAKDAALQQCHADDAAFNRLEGASRLDCYERYLSAAPPVQHIPRPDSSTTRLSPIG